MKIAAFVIAIMVMCICPGRISENKDLVSGERKGPKDCQRPKAKHSTVLTDGCIQSTCGNGKWRPKMRTDICCYKQQAYKPNTVLDTILGDANCSSTTIGCGAVAQIEISHQSTCSTPSSEQQVEKLEINLEVKIEQVTSKMENLTDGIYQKLNVKIQEKGNISESNFHDVVQKIKNNKISFESQVKNLEQNIETIVKNLTDETQQKLDVKIQEIGNISESNFHDVVHKIKNNKISLESQVKTLEKNIETLVKNLTDETQQKLDMKIQETSNISESNFNDVAQKMENNKISLESLSDQVKTLETNMETMKENITDLAEMSLQIIGTLTNLTRVMVKHTEIPMVEGVLITGGKGALTSTEMYFPSTGKTCSLQSLPDNREFHSMDAVAGQIILCGGYYTQTSCLEFLQTSSTGSWAHYSTLAQGRFAHTSYLFQGELMLVGGGVSQGTTEIIGKGAQYDLNQDTYRACIIPDQASFILTGGYGYSYYSSVTRYNYQGYVENLPDLATARISHGCGYYMDKENNKVLVVAGGKNGANAFLSSTELLLPGASAWSTGEPLPRRLGYTTTSNIDGYLLLIGGLDGSTTRGEVLKFDGTWTEVGLLKTARWAAAATKIGIPAGGGFFDISSCY